MSIHDKFVADVESFLRLSGMAAARFGLNTVRDSNFIPQIRREARSPRLDMADQVYTYMEANAPRGWRRTLK